MIPVIIVVIAGISGLEGLFFAKQSAEIKGFEAGSNYQRQSAIAMLSYAVSGDHGIERDELNRNVRSEAFCISGIRERSEP